MTPYDLLQTKLRRNLSHIGQRLETAARSAVNQAAGPETHAPPGSPPYSQSGAGAASIGTRVELSANTLRLIVGTDAPHMMFQELGSSSREPREWLGPTFRRAKPSITRDLAR